MINSFIATAASEFITVTTISVIITSLSTLTLGVFIGSLVTYHIMKKRALYKLNEQLQSEMDGNYAVVANLGAINMGFDMKDNDAYGPVRRQSSGETGIRSPVTTL